MDRIFHRIFLLPLGKETAIAIRGKIARGIGEIFSEGKKRIGIGGGGKKRIVQSVHCNISGYFSFKKLEIYFV